MSSKVVLTPQAEHEIQSAHDWWAEHRSPNQAARWYGGIFTAIDSLRSDPQRCPLSVENDDFSYELREHYYGLGNRPTHRIIFTERPEMVLVLAVRHLAQQQLSADDLP